MKIFLHLQKSPWIISGGIFDKENVQVKFKELEKISSQDDFWKNQSLVKKTLKKKNFYENILKSYQKLFEELKNIKDLFELAT